MPTGCHGPLRSTIEAESWEEPGKWAKKSTVTHNAAGTPVSLTGCSKLRFPAEISVAPDSSNASTSSGLTVNVHVPQTAALNPNGLAESALRDTTVALPEGVAINPSGGGGLEACSSEPAALGGALGSPGDQIGYKGQEELNKEYEPGVKWNTFTPEVASPLAPGANFCPNGSKVGTAKIKTPLLEHVLEGIGVSGHSERKPVREPDLDVYRRRRPLFRGALVKLAGEVHAEPADGSDRHDVQKHPPVAFEDAELHFFGGERAPLSTPCRCGAYTTSAIFTPWAGNGHASSTFNITSARTVVLSRAGAAVLPVVDGGRDEHQGRRVQAADGDDRPRRRPTEYAVSAANLPPGLSGLLSSVELCGEPQANEGQCGESKIGETTSVSGSAPSRSRSRAGSSSHRPLQWHAVPAR